MQTSETRTLVRAFLDARAAGDIERIAGLLAEDAVWQPPPSAGFGPFTGRDDVARALAGGATGRLFDPTTVRREVHHLIVEDDVAVALQRLTATTRKGTAYENEYCWVFTCTDDRIARLDEFTDTLKAALTFGSASLRKPG